MSRARLIPSSAAPCTWASLLSSESSCASPSHFAARQQLPLLAGRERHASAATQLKCFQPIACQCSPVGGDPPPFRLPSQTFEFKRPPSTGHATPKASDSSSNLQLVMQPRPATRAAPAASATRCSGSDCPDRHATPTASDSSCSGRLRARLILQPPSFIPRSPRRTLLQQPLSRLPHAYLNAHSKRLKLLLQSPQEADSAASACDPRSSCKLYLTLLLQRLFRAAAVRGDHGRTASDLNCSCNQHLELRSRIRYRTYSRGRAYSRNCYPREQGTRAAPAAPA